MDKNAVWKWLILVVLLTFSVWVATPPGEKIRLGLDLRGGTSFTVGIDTAEVRREIAERDGDLTPEQLDGAVREALREAQSRALEVLRNRVDNLGIAEPIIFAEKDNRIVVQLPGIDDAKREEAERSIRSAAFLEFRLVHERNDRLTDALFERGVSPEGYRIERLEQGTFYRRVPDYAQIASDEGYRRRLASFETPGAEFEFLLQREEVGNQTVYRPFFVRRRREFSGDYLKSAAVDYRALGQPVVKLQFDARGARLFANVTSDYAPGGARNPNPNEFRQLAIVLDGTLYSAPVIREAIYGGRAEISGRFTVPEATFLSNILKAGSLPAPVEIVEKRFVAPTLGRDSVRSGMRAVAYGGVGVLLFMAVYYLASGLIADVALILNMLLLPLGMIVAAGFLGIFARDAGVRGAVQLPVLTLPGIAGILLTIGIAVDANVLIFERIREEVRSGKRLWSAVLAGYDRAFVTIVDANVTTLLTGVILFLFGSGPIRGFAVTLCAGILVSLFTSLVVTKLVYGLFAEKMKSGMLRMLAVLGETRIDFLKRGKLALVVSAAVAVATWALLLGRGVPSPDRVLGVDFVGGASLTFAYGSAEGGSAVQTRYPLGAVRSVLEDAGLGEFQMQYQKEFEDGGRGYLQVRIAGESDADPGETAFRALAAAFPDAGFELLAQDSVGPQVGNELKRRAVWSIVLALLGIIVYISWRFELGFALGAIAALVHDVLVTVGIYAAFGRQLSLPVVAALLTIVGYSVNDTIVVFDRIREDLRIVRNRTFADIANLSINQTLSRTLLTSLTTLLAVGMLLAFGGGAISDFALTLFIGVLVGTYSSVFVATPVVLAWYKGRKPEFATARK